MSFLSDLFNGGVSTHQIPGAQSYIDPIEKLQADDHGLSYGLGSAGKIARGNLKAINDGHLDQTGGYKAIQDAISGLFRSKNETNDRAVGAQTALLNQPALTAGIQADLRNKNTEAEGDAEGKAAVGFENDQANQYQRARDAAQQARMFGANFDLNKYTAGLNGYLASMYQTKKPSILSNIGQLAGTAAAVAG